jgi:hypothetical protein
LLTVIDEGRILSDGHFSVELLHYIEDVQNNLYDKLISSETVDYYDVMLPFCKLRDGVKDLIDNYGFDDTYISLYNRIVANVYEMNAKITHQTDEPSVSSEDTEQLIDGLLDEMQVDMGSDIVSESASDSESDHETLNGIVEEILNDILSSTLDETSEKLSVESDKGLTENPESADVQPIEIDSADVQPIEIEIVENPESEVIECPTECFIVPITESVIEPEPVVMEMVIESPIETVTELIMESPTEYLIETVEESVVECPTEYLIEPVIETTEGPIAKPAVEPVVECHTECLIEPGIETEPVKQKTIMDLISDYVHSPVPKCSCGFSQELIIRTERMKLMMSCLRLEIHNFSDTISNISVPKNTYP